MEHKLQMPRTCAQAADFSWLYTVHHDQVREKQNLTDLCLLPAALHYFEINLYIVCLMFQKAAPSKLLTDDNLSL